jgi:hypothetical protein
MEAAIETTDTVHFRSIPYSSMIAQTVSNALRHCHRQDTSSCRVLLGPSDSGRRELQAILRPQKAHAHPEVLHYTKS